jgi:DNA-binding CsgD family transcriptional regulator
MLKSKASIKEMIQAFTALSSFDELCDVFGHIAKERGYDEWCYLVDQRIIQDKNAKKFSGLDVLAHSAKNEISFKDGPQISRARKARIADIFRQIETPCFLEDISDYMTVSTDRLQSLCEFLKIDGRKRLLIVPCFNPGIGAGYVALTQQKGAPRPSHTDLTELALQCQLAHMHFRRIMKNMQQDGHLEKAKLSDREQKILSLIAEGFSNIEIALALDISPHIINVYLKAIMKKTNSQTRVTAVINAMALGYIK